MAFTAKDVVDLREKTGAGMLDCKKALTECNGDMAKAVDYLREKGIAAVAKRQSRIAAEGAVFSYIHMNGTIGVLLEVNCETDFVAKSPAFQELGHDVSMHIAAANGQQMELLTRYVNAHAVVSDAAHRYGMLQRERIDQIRLAHLRNQHRFQAVECLLESSGLSVGIVDIDAEPLHVTLAGDASDNASFADKNRGDPCLDRAEDLQRCIGSDIENRSLLHHQGNVGGTAVILLQYIGSVRHLYLCTLFSDGF